MGSEMCIRDSDGTVDWKKYLKHDTPYMRKLWESEFLFKQHPQKNVLNIFCRLATEHQSEVELNGARRMGGNRECSCE